MSDEERARFEILLEEIRGHVKVVAEGHRGLDDKMDAMGARMDRLETKVDRLEMKVDVLGNDVAVLKTDVAVLKTDMRRVKEHLHLNGTPAKPRVRSKTTPKKQR